jgi:hypothetical protein
MMLNSSRAEPINIDARHDRAIVALLGSPTVKGAAKQCRISESTILRWLRDDEDFINAYRGARRAVVQHATTSLQRACAMAVGTLESVASDPVAPAAARVSAAKAILETAIKAIEIDDLDARLSALEARNVEH